MLRQKLRSVFDEFEIPAVVSGISSFFGIHFRDNEITDYRSTLNSNKSLRKLLFLGLINNGVLLQSQTAGALNILSTETEINILVNTIRDVLQRIKD
jgi:glutamate-1-semialdehyde aminotransferase